MFAYDSDVPENKAEAVVLINVIRNPDPPFVDRLTYNIDLDEFYNVRFAVLDLNATDPNGVSTMDVLGQISSVFIYPKAAPRGRMIKDTNS